MPVGTEPMRRVITQRELRNDSARVLREVEAGETLLIARGGVPIAELRPAQPRRFVARTAIATAAAKAPRVDFLSLRADLNAVVDS
jgi:antitoxin (DNA-binding transcriptional repressor) of toxin-antitoxin stability system